MSNLTISSLQFALNGLDVAEQAASSNIANAQTPGYSAQSVSFEPQLQAALAAGSGSPTARVAVGLSAAAPGTNANNVSLPKEITGLQIDTLQYQALSSALNAKFRILAAAATQA